MRTEPNPANQHHVNKRNQRNFARMMIFNRAKKIIQKAGSVAVAAPASAGTNLLTVAPLTVGLLLGFVVEVTGTVTNTGSGALTRTPNGSDNLLTNIQFNDFTGNPRHNASGRAFSYVEASKWHHMPGASYTSDATNGYVANVASNACPASIANAGSAAIARVFHIPIAENNELGMAGALYLGVNNQNTLLKMTVNAAAVVVGGGTGDPLTAMYTGTSGTLTNVSINVYQEYWTDLPREKGSNKLLLPIEDLETAYMLTELNASMALTSGTMTYFNFPTFAEMLGFYFAYDNAFVLNAGTDWSRTGLYVSNFATVREYDPNTMDRAARDQCHSSFPLGQYGFFLRQHPLNVDQYPSLQFGFSPSSVGGATAYVDVTMELFRKVQFMEEASGVGGG